MSPISLEYLIFLFAALIIYYIMPKKLQWTVLLAASLFFYCYGGFKGVEFILITSATTFGAALGIDAIASAQKKYIKEHKAELTKQQKDNYKKRCGSKRRLILIAALVINFGILCVFKYAHFAIEQFNSLLGLFGGKPVKDTLSLIIPLGISFYTFQSMGYLLDVYWGKSSAERNYAKMLLFVSFFPQTIQGPISSYSQLSQELFAEHTFNYKNYSWGFQRLLWGLFKKIVIANALAPSVANAFANYNEYAGIAVFNGMILHCLRLYADFSGYMDISCGACEMFGIKLAENFDRPFFSKSLSEFWRRWHITLGAWFKNYIFFPIAVSKWNNKLSNSAQKKLGKFFGQTLLATIPLVAVWFLTGLWHGASWTYIIWGLANGAVIIFSLWMKPVYTRCKDMLHIKESNRLWQAFQVARTCLVFSFIEVFPEVGTFDDGVGFLRRMLTNHNIPSPSAYRSYVPFIPIDNRPYFNIAVVGLLLMLAVSLIQRKRPARELFNKLPSPVRIVLLAVLFTLVATVSAKFSVGAGGFMYANF